MKIATISTAAVRVGEHPRHLAAGARPVTRAEGVGENRDVMAGEG
ncbi:hypothetical protein [Microtetraspora fusca]|nr:hypothetical protein [Microtetraspora fusca]